ncbi:hypothetical protein [Burkholderia pseudomallei]|uniref:hypothetical protein n=1 Tax=Burkholderia pseudomallei TaxID=28450 RepID=UPI0021F77E6C|nr:hypothetical protein [Burkholderia pseudomallei]MCW0159662.1 hypothetical protein [Burkholderia pseudomallei]
MIEVLHVLRDAAARGELLTLDEIVRHVADKYNRHHAETNGQGRMPPPYLLQKPYLYFWSRIMNDLADLGLASQAPDREWSSGTVRWGVGGSWHPPASDGNGGNNRGGGGDGNDPGRPEGEDGGSGLSEVLGHPVLFSLPGEAFDALIDGLFEEVQ